MGSQLDHPATKQDRLRDAAQQLRTLGGPGRRHPDTFYRRIGESYNTLVADGEPHPSKPWRECTSARSRPRPAGSRKHAAADTSPRRRPRMPRTQRGSVVKRGKSYAARWYDENGERRFLGGFRTESEAWACVDEKVDAVKALRRGDRPSPASIPTVNVLVDGSSPPTRSTPRRSTNSSTNSRTPSGSSVTSASTSSGRWSCRRGGRRCRRGPAISRSALQASARGSRNPRPAREQSLRTDQEPPRQARREPGDPPVLIMGRGRRDRRGTSPLYRALPAFLVGTGMRPEEALALEWRDLDRKRRWRVSSGCTRRDGRSRA